MLWGQLQELLDLLDKEEYRTAASLAGQLEVSEKTARTRIRELHDLLEKHGAGVVSKPRFGYRLEITDQASFDAYINEQQQSNEWIPEKRKERSEYLLAYLIARNSYIRIEELCDFLYVSKSTLTNSLRSTESILKNYRLSIDRRPNYGIKITGLEFDIRRLMIDYFIRQHSLPNINVTHQDQEIAHMSSMVRQLLKSYEIFISEMSYGNFVEYLYISWKRMKSGHYLEPDTERVVDTGIKEKMFIKELVSVMQEWGQVSHTKAEEDYLCLYLAGKRMIGNAVENDANFIIREQMDRLAVAMIDLVSKEYGLDLYHNFEIRMTINQHLVPFDIRIRYDIPLMNPMLSDIKQNYSFAYQIAYDAVRVLRAHYNKPVSEDEIGYFALIFQLVLEERKSGNHSDILIVCSAGKASSRLLKYRYENEFAGYLNNIYICDLQELEHFDFKKVDYIFATVPIKLEVPVPIVEVGSFLESNDIQKITDILRTGNNREIMERYYSPDRFLRNVRGSSKDEILETICSIIMEQEQVDDDFYELVLERESFAQMDYGNGIAIPHPNRIASQETFAYVAVLNEPVIWNNLPVQVVLLSSVGRQKDKHRQKFYEATARFSLDKEAVNQLIQDPRFEVLIRLLQ